MATPSVMIRFRDSDGATIAEHHKIFDQKGRVLWGLWLKAFEDKEAILERLRAEKIERVYVADTTSKSEPSIFVCDVKRVLSSLSAADGRLIPKYYRNRREEVPIWFELSSRLGAIDADKRLIELLGVPTIYFLDYDKSGKIINAAPQRLYPLAAHKEARWALLLSDIHLGDDHAFRYPVTKNKHDIGPQRTLSEVLQEDLKNLGALGRLGCVVISGDILTKGAWSTPHDIGDEKFLGLDLAKLFLDDLSNAISVDPDRFLMVPGNHDIVREISSPSDVQEALLHYTHEHGFRTLREDFCRVYKLSPLNYVAKISHPKGSLLLGLLNSAYLNEQTEFSEYGYVGDDADNVFDLLLQHDSKDVTKIVVVHHHLLPVYEREVLAAGGKISMTLDAARLLRRAQEAGVSTIVHGHQHSTKQMIYSAASSEMSKESRTERRLINVVAAGSSGANRQRLPADETNAYALIELDGSDPAVRMRRIFPDGRRAEDW